MNEDWVWRVLGPVWATGVVLAMGFPITLGLAGMAVSHTTIKRPRRLSAVPRQLFWPMTTIVMTWGVAAAFQAEGLADSAPPPAWPTYVVLGLLLLNLALGAWLARRHQSVPGRTMVLGFQLWVGVVARFIGLWWVLGWPSL